ncbi:MAG TPA: carboxypeptidase regulatory-like domain-containing protein, partial [Puia sp.]|nr:carboxypeptidase regulatory-like domain-containing protein [Puia sp.]
MTRFQLTLRGCFLGWCCLFLLLAQAQQADRHIRGTVKGPDGAPLAGATVALTSDKKIATATDAAGAFSLSLPAGFTASVELEISSVGLETRRVTVQRGQPAVEVVMENSRSSLNEVVVTALGINREKKSLGYSVTTVKGDEFTQARENNIANALSGKVAGVNAAGLSTGPGGSSRVTIRGNGTLGPDNQPLYVVNGMPIDNSVPG